MGKKMRESRKLGGAVTGGPTPGDNAGDHARPDLPSTEERIENIPVGDIVAGEGCRPLDEVKVGELMGSIAAAGKGVPGRGLLQFPTVAEDRRTLLFGRHRFEAVKRLGWSWLPCRVLPLSGLEAELAAIDENLIRSGLTVLRRAEQLARRVEILDVLGLRRQAGGQPGPDTVSGPTRSTEEIAGEANISGRTLQRDAKIVSEIPADLRRRLYGTDIEDSTTQLLRVAALDEDGKRRLGEALAGGVASVRQALDDVEASVRQALDDVEASSREVPSLPGALVAGALVEPRVSQTAPPAPSPEQTHATEIPVDGAFGVAATAEAEVPAAPPAPPAPQGTSAGKGHADQKSGDPPPGKTRKSPAKPPQTETPAPVPLAASWEQADEPARADLLGRPDVYDRIVEQLGNRRWLRREAVLRLVDGWAGRGEGHQAHLDDTSRELVLAGPDTQPPPIMPLTLTIEGVREVLWPAGEFADEPESGQDERRPGPEAGDALDAS